MTAGCRSIIPLKTARASSYPSSPGRINSPRKPAANSCTAASSRGLPKGTPTMSMSLESTFPLLPLSSMGCSPSTMLSHVGRCRYPRIRPPLVSTFSSQVELIPKFEPAQPQARMSRQEERHGWSGDRIPYAIVCACPAKAAGESRRGRPPKVKGPSWGRAESLRQKDRGPEGRPGEFGRTEAGADGVTLSGLGQGGNRIGRSPNKGVEPRGALYTALRRRHPRDARDHRGRDSGRPLRRRVAEVRRGPEPPTRALGVRGALGRKHTRDQERRGVADLPGGGGVRQDHTHRHRGRYLARGVPDLVHPIPTGD